LDQETGAVGAWRTKSGDSLAEVFRTIPIPKDARFWTKLGAFSGPGYLVAVGYMDPGNWATDLAGGSQFGYTLLSVILLSNIMAIVLQALAAKLGIVTGRDLAQACRDHYSRPIGFMLWVACEIAIIACDLAEVIGTAIALQLLFGLPLVWGICITSINVLLILALQQRGFRKLEAFIVALLIVIAGCFAVQLALSQPAIGDVLSGFVPTAQVVTNPAMLYIAIGILGATVMPHNLYLHSSIVQTRAFDRDDAGKREAIKFATIDSSVALSLALFVNSAILILAASTFYVAGRTDVAEIQDAYQLLSPMLREYRQHVVRGRAAGVGPEFGDHGDARRADRHGGVPEAPPACLATAADHAPARDHSGRHGRGAVR